MNYKKCDFTPIMGAKVRIRTKDDMYYNGKLLCRQRDKNSRDEYDHLAILERESGGAYWSYNAPTDRIISLEATMKPRDMNQEQLHRLAEEIAIEHYGERYPGIEYIAFVYEADGKLSDEICVCLRDMPLKDGFVLDPNKSVDITHWLKENDHV